MRNRTRTPRAGFTLIEVLVTLVLLALLLGVIVPQVINQLDRGDPTRVSADLESIRSGAKLFRVDVKRYPATIEQLVEAPGAAGANWDSVGDINAVTLPNALIDRWNGPYLESDAVANTTTFLQTALGGQIHPILRTANLANNSYLTIYVGGLGISDIQNVSEFIDGDTVTSNDDAGGRLRALGTSPDTLLFLAVPVN